MVSFHYKAELARKISETIVAEIKPSTVPYNGDGRFAKAAKDWIRGNSQGNAKTVVGEVKIAAGAVGDDANHNSSEGYIFA